MQFKSRQKGFLLLEVLLALVILSAGILAVIKTYSIGLRAQRYAEHQTSAFLLASRLQEEIEAGVIGSLEAEELIDACAFKWNIEIKESLIQGLKLVEVKVSWQERLREEEISLVNLYHEDMLDEVF